MKVKVSLVLLLLLTLNSVKADSFKVKGRLESAFRLDEAFRQGQVNNELQLDFKTKRIKKVKVKGDVRYESDSNQATLRELFMNYKKESGNLALVGKQRKSVSYAFTYGQSKRLSILRPAIYEKLVNLGLVGRQTGFRYISKDQEGKKSYIIGVYSGEGLNYSSLFSKLHHLSDRSYIKWSLLAQADRRNSAWKAAGLASIMHLIELSKWRFLHEAFFGLDSLTTTITGEKTYFAALRSNFEYGRDFRVFFDLSFREANLRDSSQSFDIASGLKYYINDNFYIGTQVSFITKPLSPAPESDINSNFFTSESQFYLTARYYVD